MSYYDSDPQASAATTDALEAADAEADAGSEDNLGDGGAFGKFCILEGTFKPSCQNCTGLVCSAIKW